MSTAKELFDISVAAGSDLSAKQFYIVKRSGGNLAVCSTAGERALGVLQDDPAASGRTGVVRCGGLSKVIYGGTVSQDDLLTTDASGKAVAVAASGGRVLGRANKAGVLNDIGEVLMFGAEGWVGAGKKTIQLPLAVARELASNEYVNTAGDAGVLSNDTTPVLEAINPGTDQAVRLRWASSNNDKIGWQIALPSDLDDSAAITLHTFGEMAGATDTPTLTWEAFFGKGDTDAGGATAALSSTLAEQSVTVAAGDVLAAPNFLALTLTPGAHTTDALHLYAAWIEYTAK
jgi:hypothetical protein